MHNRRNSHLNNFIRTPNFETLKFEQKWLNTASKRLNQYRWISAINFFFVKSKIPNVIKTNTETRRKLLKSCKKVNLLQGALCAKYGPHFKRVKVGCVDNWFLFEKYCAISKIIADTDDRMAAKGVCTFFIGNSIFHLSLELLTKFWKTSLKVS